MVNLTYEKKRKIQIYLIAALLMICCVVLVSCNQDNSYSVAGETVSEPTHFMAKFMLIINDNVLGEGVSFGWTVVIFTVFLRLILFPLDLWQKLIGRKNSKAMKRMKPQLEALQEKFANDKQRLQQEQMALYKKEHYSMMGMCLPTIITFVVFFVVFAGFRQMVGFQYAKDYKACQDAYNASISNSISAMYGDANADGKFTLDDITKDEDGYVFYKEAVSKAQLAVKDVYYSDEQTAVRSWLWINNIFVADNWEKAVPDFATVTGQSGYATSRLAGITQDEYNTVMGAVLGTGGYGKNNGKWNGLLVLPILSILLSFISTKLTSKSSGEAPPQMPQVQDKNADPNEKPKDPNASMKMMQYIMPLMMGVFAILYSGAFALYMFTSSFVAIAFQLTFNLICMIVDKKQEGKENPNIAKR